MRTCYRLMLMLAFVLTATAATAQAERDYGKEIAELRQMLPGMEGQAKLDVLGRIFGISEHMDDTDLQLRCVDELIAEARRQHNLKEEGHARVNRVVLFYNNDMNDSVFFYAPREKEFFKSHEDWTSYYEVWMHLVNTCIFSGDTHSGLEEAEAMYADAKERKNDYGMGVSYYAMGNTYAILKNLDKSADAYKKSLAILSTLDSIPPVMTDLYSYYGDILNEKKDYRELKSLTRQWKGFLERFFNERKYLTMEIKEGETEKERLSRQAQDVAKRSVYYAYYYLACAQANVGLDSLQQASEMLDSVQKYDTASGNFITTAWLFCKAQLNLKQGHYGDALYLNSLRMEMLNESEDKMDAIAIYQQRAEILKKLGRYEEAAQMYEQMYLTNDSINSEDIRNKLTEMDTRFQLSETKMKQERAQWILMSIIGVVVVVALVIFSIFRYRAAKRLAVAHEKLLVAYDNLEETTTAKERIESDLRIARGIQMGMVPQKFPPFPERTDIDLFASMTPAKEVGGDLYDFVLLGEKLYFCLGDVSGKGVPASLFMAVARNLFRVVAQQELPPAEIATKLNNALAEDNENGMFVTMFIGVIHLPTGHMDFCNAGHNPPVVITPHGGDGTTPNDSVFIDMLPNAPLGLWPGLDYDGESIDDISGKPFFVYSDGLNEAENQQQDQFGDERLLDELARLPFENAQHTVEYMKEQVEKHRDGAEPSDDLTMLCVCVKGKYQ